MKKIVFIMPLMVVSFLANCGGGSVDKPLTKEEFDYANSLIDVEKVQINSKTDFEEIFESEEGKTSSSMIDDRTKELAPSINHKINLYINKEGETEDKFGNEGYSRLIPGDDKHCEYVIKENGEKDWGDPKIGYSEEYYYYPTQFAIELALRDAGIVKLEPALTYENTEFKNDKFVYKGASSFITYSSNGKTSEEPPIPVTINITYKNKKLTNVDVESEEVTTEEDDGKITIKVTASITYAYEDITPTWPLQY